LYLLGSSKALIISEDLLLSVALKVSLRVLKLVLLTMNLYVSGFLSANPSFVKPETTSTLFQWVNL